MISGYPGKHPEDSEELFTLPSAKHSWLLTLSHRIRRSHPVEVVLLSIRVFDRIPPISLIQTGGVLVFQEVTTHHAC